MDMRFAENGTSIVIGDMFIPSYDDAPFEVRALVDAAGGLAAVLPYEVPPPTLPALTPRQLRLMMLTLGLTEANIVDQIEGIPDPIERAAALIEWNWATQYERDHALVGQLAAALDFEPAELDALWIYAADL